ncbi:MAG: response regulator [Gallionellaceae bacterium]|nr:response regulator [Gallionellaceae bacterium]
MKSVLLVDDDRVVLNLLAEGLRDRGYRVGAAQSADEALKLIGEGPYDLAVLDVRMPGRSGLELAQTLKRGGDPPFVFLSAYSDETVVRQASEAGALGYLVKPVDTQQLVPFIEAALARGKDIDALRGGNERLERALQVEQKTRTAVGIIMVRKGLDRQAAFELLRNRAREQRRKINEVAEDLIAAVETTNGVLDGVADSKR